MKKVVVSGDEAKVQNAKLGDLITTVFSSTEHLTGFAALGQKVGLAVAGAALGSYYQNGTFNFTRRFAAR